ncbi:MAG: NADH-quinone oxidoreductase subunit C [Coriobacteriia bacterium]
MRSEPQHFETISAGQLLATAQKYKDAGYRFVQCAATRVEGGFDMLYSFDRDLVLYNVHVPVAEGEGLPSISAIFPAAFVFENETHELFGIDISNISVDFKGKFYTLSVPTPMVSDTSAKEQ